MTIVDTIVSRTNTQVADSAKVLQAILAAAANERGEWELPLSAEKALPLPKAWELVAVHADRNSSRHQHKYSLVLCLCKTACSMLGAVLYACHVLAWRVMGMPDLSNALTGFAPQAPLPHPISPPAAATATCLLQHAALLC